MVKIIELQLRLGKTNSVKTKRARRPDGSGATIRVIDANSATLLNDITNVFQKNVVKARKANAELGYKFGWKSNGGRSPMAIGLVHSAKVGRSPAKYKAAAKRRSKQ